MGTRTALVPNRSNATSYSPETVFDARTGDVKWAWSGDGPGYGSPIVVELGGTRQVITMTQENLVDG